MNIGGILQNHVLWTSFVGWILAQVLKIPFDYFKERQWDWASFFAAGGMPSSHSCLVTSTAVAVGLHLGFDTPLFAVAIAFATVVVFDAAGVRRQAGMQATKINILVAELLKGHPINENQLREVIGHTPLEAIAGVFLGLLVAAGIWFWLR
jgi:uncharacterized protein